MILIGMFDSPFVRRVAVSMKLLGLPFEHRNWSVGKDFEQIRRYNPLGRVPTLVLDSGEVLIESAAILDYLDELVGPHALLPRDGEARRRGLRLMSLASGAAEKAVSQVYERAFRPEDKRHAPWVERCRSQVEGALRELDETAAKLAPNHWLLGPKMQQPDITLVCAYIFVRDALALDSQTYPALAALAARGHALPAFGETYLALDPPQT
jgi:glutathione S-transferase